MPAIISYFLSLRKKTLPRGLRRFRYNTSLTGGTVVLLIVILAAILAPLITSHNPLALDAYARLKPPSVAHWFGTDHLGRDLYTRTIFGARLSLEVGIMVMFITVFLGVLFGLMAGYFRALDMMIMRFMDAVMAFPALLLSIALMAMLGGAGSLWGPVIGAAFLVPLDRFLGSWLGGHKGLVGLDFMIYASLIMVVSANQPRGIWGINEQIRKK